jgi:hypothetical protein
MRGLDPRIHTLAPQNVVLRKTSSTAPLHGLPGQARQ